MSSRQERQQYQILNPLVRYANTSVSLRFQDRGGITAQSMPPQPRAVAMHAVVLMGMLPADIQDTPAGVVEPVAAAKVPQTVQALVHAERRDVASMAPAAAKVQTTVEVVELLEVQLLVSRESTVASTEAPVAEDWGKVRM